MFLYIENRVWKNRKEEYKHYYEEIARIIGWWQPSQSYFHCLEGAINVITADGPSSEGSLHWLIL